VLQLTLVPNPEGGASAEWNERLGARDWQTDQLFSSQAACVEFCIVQNAI
jgi:hypothetical protein